MDYWSQCRAVLFQQGQPPLKNTQMAPFHVNITTFSYQIKYFCWLNNFYYLLKALQLGQGVHAKEHPMDLGLKIVISCRELLFKPFDISEKQKHNLKIKFIKLRQVFFYMSHLIKVSLLLYRCYYVSFFVGFFLF